jgi:DNA-binding transcriptional ArsR family regulator
MNDARYGLSTMLRQSHDYVKVVDAMTRSDALFGSRLRERILKLLVLVEPAYPRQIAALLDEHLVSVQNAIIALGDLGVVASRLVGRTRLVELDRRWYAAGELRALLERLVEADTEIRELASAVRQRPRRPGKPA